MKPSYQMGIPSGACSETAESILKQPEEENFGKQEDYKNVAECQQKELICGESPRSNVQEADLTGVTAQDPEVSLEAIQEQNEGNDALIEDTAKPEQVAFHPKKGWAEMRGALDKIELYSREHNQKRGYYDGSKVAIESGRYLLDRTKEDLKQYWEQMLKFVDDNPQTRGSPEWCDWLHEGTRFLMLVEPLEIAWCSCEERPNEYLNQRRPECFKRLQKLLKDCQEGNPQPRASPPNLTKDSCFWAHVESALISCRLLIGRAPSVDSERERLRNFEDYVVKLIDDKAVSTDIFLEGSTFMTWWAEYDEILDKQMMGHSYESPLARFMRNQPRYNYSLDEN